MSIFVKTALPVISHLLRNLIRWHVVILRANHGMTGIPLVDIFYSLDFFELSYHDH